MCTVTAHTFSPILPLAMRLVYEAPDGACVIRPGKEEAMITVRQAHERGKTQTPWLDSNHTFSFNRYYDPCYVGFRDLLVINEDYVAPGMGFGTHGHQDMEIISYVVEGQ